MDNDKTYNSREEAECERNIENHPIIKALHNKPRFDIFTYKVKDLKDGTTMHCGISKIQSDRCRYLSLFDNVNNYHFLRLHCNNPRYEISICPVEEVLEYAELNANYISDLYLDYYNCDLDKMLDEFYNLIKDNLDLYPNLFLIYRYEKLILKRRLAMELTD